MSVRPALALLTLATLWTHWGVAQAAEIPLEGYVFEDNNSGYLNGARVIVLDEDTGLLYGETQTDRDGFFAVDVPLGKELLVRATKAVFEPTEVSVSSAGLTADDKLYAKVAMPRAPGYRLEVTLAEERGGDQEEVDAISGSLIEVYNNTRDTTVLTLPNHPTPYFSMQLEQGNHYTLLVRTPGYFTKRIESYVNVDGCILCMDGVSEIGPGVSDNLAHGNDMGTLLANIELRPMSLDSAIELDDIYYDYNSAKIREDAARELDKVVEMLRINPGVLVELGSHTDSRGDAKYNRELSQRRAESAVDYVVTQNIPAERLTARGYGEEEIANVCVDGIACSEEEHARNRRTELKITGFSEDPFEGMPLATILEREREAELLAEVLAGSEVRIAEDAVSPGPGDSDDVATSLDSIAALEPAARGGRTPASRTDGAVGALDALRGDLSRAPAPEVDPNSPEALAGGGSAVARGGTPRSSADAEAQIRRSVPAVERPDAGEPLLLPEGDAYSGYRVLVFTSPISLADENGELFFKFGTLREEQLADGTYGYVSGAYPSEPKARGYLAEVHTLFPDAELLRYENGFVIETP